MIVDDRTKNVHGGPRRCHVCHAVLSAGRGVGYGCLGGGLVCGGRCGRVVTGLLPDTTEPSS